VTRGVDYADSSFGCRAGARAQSATPIIGSMAINYTTVGPLSAKARMTDGAETNLTIVAFAWHDAQPYELTGLWTFGRDGIRYVPIADIATYWPN
jgi:hypothetical protein